MAIIIPSGRPNWRFMRYVRPPMKDSKLEPLYPLRPATRPLRLGIDVAAVAEPPGDLTGFLTRDEVEVHLLIPKGQQAPPAWSELLHESYCHTVNFTTAAEAGRFLDAVEFSVATTRGETYRAWSKARFFAAYQQLDEQDAGVDLSPLALEERHRAAAYAAAAGTVGIDAIVTTAPTAGRSDVADNDVVISVTPEEAVPLIGHYLRVTSNPIVMIERGALLGGGTWETTESTATVVNLYDWGTVSGLPYFDAASSFAAAAKGGPEAAEAFRSMRIRLSRAARAFDHLLADLSDNDRIRVVGELEARLPIAEDDQTSRKHNCPACGNYMWVVYDVQREIDVDDSDAPHSIGLYAIVSATVNHAECPVCNLHLDQEDLILTDVPFSLDLGTDEATAEEEDGWRGARDAERGDEWEYADIDPADYGYEEDGPEA